MNLTGFSKTKDFQAVFSSESHQTTFPSLLPLNQCIQADLFSLCHCLAFLSPHRLPTKQKQQNYFLSSSFLISLAVQPSISSSSFFMTIYPFICLSSGCHGVSGGSREVTGVCLAALSSAFLMSLKHLGSANYGDEAIQAGQKVTDLANRDSFCSSYLSFPLLYSSFLLVFFTLTVHLARCNEEGDMLNCRASCLCFSSHASFFPLFYLFIQDAVLMFGSLVSWLLQSSFSAQNSLSAL